MFGIEDRVVLTAYLLCIISVVLCVVYGILNWNRGEEPAPRPEDVQWVKHEKAVEEEEI